MEKSNVGLKSNVMLKQKIKWCDEYSPAEIVLQQHPEAKDTRLTEFYLTPEQRAAKSKVLFLAKKIVDV